MRRPVVTVLAAGLLIGACGAPDRTPAVPRPTTAQAAATSPAPTTCSPRATASYKASTDGGTKVAEIKKRGRLVVGISADTRLLGARDLRTNAFEGLDIQVARRVAQSMFGDSWAQHLQFKTISAAQRIPYLQDGSVDVVARAMTMTCARWQQVEFSEPYFVATQRVLIRNGSTQDSLPKLAAAKAKVCATAGSTSITRLAAFKGVQAVGVPLTTDCLVLWQQGKVDAITGDDAILAGLAQQDPSARVAGPADVEQEPYGLAVKKGSVDLARYLNSVLEKMRGGDWQRAYADSGLAAVLKSRNQPAADFGRG